MKKLLLATTAIALSFGASSAFAMSGAEISLSGNSKWTYKDVDDGENAGGANNSSFAIGNLVTVATSATADSGLTYGTSLTLNTGGGAVSDDGMKLFIKGGFGEIRSGSAGAGDSYGIDVDGLVDGEVKEAGGSNAAKAGDSSISYYTPSISGIEAALTYTDAGDATKADTSEIGLKFSTSVGGNSLGLQFAQANTSGDGKSSGTDSTKNTAYGASFGIGGVEVRFAAYNSEGLADEFTGEGDTEPTKFTYNSERIEYGASYQLNDSVKLGLYIRDGETDDHSVAGTYSSGEFSETAASLTYTVAPGLTTNLAYTDSEHGDDDSSATTAYIKVAF